jgi:hypothetical protein
MPPNAPFFVPADQKILTDIYDPAGNLIATMGMHEYSVPLPNGSVEVHKRAQCIATVDGLAWSPMMALRQHDPILVVLCDSCRHPEISLFRRPPATHGLCTIQNAQQCVSCGKTVCPRHRRIGTDGEPRCRRCARWFWLKCLLRPIFFRRIKE